MAEKKSTVGGMYSELFQNKPITGTPATGGTAITDNKGNYVAGDNPKDDNAITRENPPSADDTTKRVGDWINVGGNQWIPVKDSETDLKQRYFYVKGGLAPLEGPTFGDYVNAAASGISTSLFSSGFAGPLAPAAGLLSGISTFIDAQKEKTKEWLDQDVDYDIALSFETDKDGRSIAKIDYEKMDEATQNGSGADIKKYTDSSNSGVTMDGDNNMTINVSQAFANSDRFKEVVENIKDMIPSLTKDEAEEIVDKETGLTRLDMIEKYVLGEEDQYYYSAQSAARFKRVAPGASEESLAEAASTQLIGNLSTKDLEKANVVIYDNENKKQEVNAKEYLDSIKKMSDSERNDYMLSIGNRIHSDDISDDEKAVLQAQANALYDASSNDGEYNGIYQKDFWDTIGDAGGLFTGVPLRSLFGGKSLETFRENEILAPLINGATSVGRMLMMGKLGNKIESSLLRPALSKLGGVVGDNAIGNFLKGINEFAPQDAPQNLAKMLSMSDGNTLRNITVWAGKTATQMGAMVGSDMIYEAGRAGVFGLTGQDFDFLGELGSDIAMDALMTYGPRNYVDAMHTEKYEYRRFDGDVTRKYEADSFAREATKKEDKNLVSAIADDELTDIGVKGPEGVGIRDNAGLVEITANELAQRHAERMLKWSNSKVGLKVQELFSDKNAAMQKLAINIRAITGSNFLYRRMLRFAGDIKQITRDTIDEYKQFGSVGAHWDNFNRVLNSVAPRAKDFSKADADYINAMANKHRFTEENKGNKEATGKIEKFYEKAINGVSAERAEQLNELMTAMRALAGDVLDFYVKKGVMTAEQARNLRKLPAYKNGMFLPVWSAKHQERGGDIAQSRAKMKRVFDPEQLIAVEDLMNPLVALTQYINNAARNVAINERALAIKDAASLAGMTIHVYSDTGGALEEVDNLKELNKEFADKYGKIVEKVKKDIPSHQQWTKINETLVLESEAMKSAEGLKKLKNEHKKLQREYNKALKEQEKLGKTLKEEELDLYDSPSDLSDRLVRDKSGGPKIVKIENIGDAIKALGVGKNRTMSLSPNARNELESYFTLKFAKDKKGANGNVDEARRQAKDVISRIEVEAQRALVERLGGGAAISRLSDAVLRNRIIDAYNKVIPQYISKKDLAELTKQIDYIVVNIDARAKIEQRDRAMKWWAQTEALRRRLGVESYTYGYENKREVGENVYGTHSVVIRRGLDGERYSVEVPEKIKIALEMFESLSEMESTIVHEAAHEAFDKAANRVPLVNDALRILGVKANVSRAIANSRDAHELIAHMTTAKYLSGTSAAKSEKALNDPVVQRHLNSILKNIGNEAPVNFKERFIEQIQNIITFVKAKLTNRSLRNVKTLEDFYNGLVNGDFSTEMRLKTGGQRFAPEEEVLVSSGKGPGRRSETSIALDFDWSKIDPEAEAMATKLIDLQNKIDENNKAQAKAMDDIRDNAKKLMEEAQGKSKGAPVKLDIESYVDVQITNDLALAFKSNNTVGMVQGILNKAVETANPYVSRKSVIDKLASEAAHKFRKDVAKKMVIKERSGGKLSQDHLNMLADKAYDAITRKIVGEKAHVKALDDDELTKILNSSGESHTIRYMIDGEEHRMVLAGNGSESLVKEFYEPEFKLRGPVSNRVMNAARSVAQAKRFFTSSMLPSRVLPNIARDWTRGIVTTGGNILLSPDDLRAEVISSGKYTDEEITKINNGFELASAGIAGSTFNESMQTPKKNRQKSIIQAARKEQAGNGFTRFVVDRTESFGRAVTTLQDMGEEFTRKRAMETAYYKELADATARGDKIDVAVKKAVEAAYFYGREATTNFFRRGKLISQVAQLVPYLSQRFASLESFKLAFLDDPISVSRSLKATVSTYSALIAIALSNEESRKKYYMLTEYDRGNNIIIPLSNDMIMTIPLDDTVAAFLTPYRRMIETLNGVDPEAFYLWGVDFLEALSPADLTGFSEGDKLNVKRGLEKLAAEFVPTWALPILETMVGEDFQYGTSIAVDSNYVGDRTGNYTPTAGELTTKGANSKSLAAISNATGIPQWVLQRYVKQYGGTVFQYMVNIFDKTLGATEEEQGGKDFQDAIFKPFTGADSDAVESAFWDGVNSLEEKKSRLKNELKSIASELSTATGDTKAELQKKRRQKISEYGMHVSDFLNQYLSAYEITGGITKLQANKIWRLYEIYDEDGNAKMYDPDSTEEYYSGKISSGISKKATNLAGESGLDKYYAMTKNDYDTSYGYQALKNSIYGIPQQQVAELAKILEDTSDYDNSFTKMKSDMYNARRKAYAAKNWDEYNKIAYQYDYKVLTAIYPYLVKNGIAETLNRKAVMDYLEDWIVVPTEEQRTSKGRYVPNLGVDSEKEKAFKKQFIKKMYGVQGE